MNTVVENDIPLIVSVDDHVVEPPTLFEGRFPAKFADRAPVVKRSRLRFVGGSKGKEWVADPEARWCDAWHFEDSVLPLMWLLAAIGESKVDVEVATYDEIAPSTWIQADRIAAMDANHVEAAMCFPNIFRFAGQTFSEQKDKDVSLLAIKAYNDWVIEEWSGGAGRGRLLPVAVVPLWDAELAAAEVRRCADKGSFLVSFPESTAPLGFPSLYRPDGYWTPFLQACEDTYTVLNMHIGSSSRTPHATPEAPYIVDSAQWFVNSQGSLLDFIFSGTLERHPDLRLSYSEAQVGWLPYVMDRADKLWAERADNSFGSSLPKRPSEYIRDRIYFCMFEDQIGLELRHHIGMDQITFETDFPHADSTFPNTKATFAAMTQKAGLSHEEQEKLARSNAIRGYGLNRYGLTV